jgi:hypothetical protein
MSIRNTLQPILRLTVVAGLLSLSGSGRAAGSGADRASADASQPALSVNAGDADVAGLDMTRLAPDDPLRFDLPFTLHPLIWLGSQIDYSDPVGQGIVPLTLVAGREDESIAPGYRLADFAARDGAPFARISPDLVQAVDQIRVYVGAPVHVNSAYRHRSHNHQAEVGGAAQSQHMAGLAADLSGTEHTPLELARAAIELLGCEIGLGLGPGFLHLDLRGWRASWAVAGADLDDDEFDRWVADLCGRQADVLFADDASDAEEVRGQANSFVELHRELMASYADLQRRRGIEGAVIIDLRSEQARPDDHGYRLAFAAQGSPESRMYGVDALMRGTLEDDYFPFVLIGPNGDRTVGFMTRNAMPESVGEAAKDEVSTIEDGG